MQLTVLRRLSNVCIAFGIVGTVAFLIAVRYLGTMWLELNFDKETLGFFAIVCCAAAVPVVFLFLAIALRKIDKELFESQLSLIRQMDDLRKALESH